MKTLTCLLFAIGLILPTAAADSPGLYLRKVVSEGTAGAVAMKDQEGDTVFVSAKAIITPQDVESAAVEGKSDVRINFKFKPAGQAKLKKGTSSMIGEKLAIVIDGKLLSTPVVRSEFYRGANVSGNFTREWAEAVVTQVAENSKG